MLGPLAPSQTCAGRSILSCQVGGQRQVEGTQFLAQIPAPRKVLVPDGKFGLKDTLPNSQA